MTERALEDLPRFVKKLRPSDEVAVEITPNTRLFHEAVAPHVARMVVVDTHQFRVISQSVKKTDLQDAPLLALYLLLPDVRMQDKKLAHLALADANARHSGEATQRTEKQVNNILSARGVNLAKEALSSEKKLAEVLELPCDEVVTDRAAGDCGTGSQPEPEYRRVGEDHCRGRLQAGGP